MKLTMYKWHHEITLNITIGSYSATAQSHHARNYALAVNSKVSLPSRNPKNHEKYIDSTKHQLYLNDFHSE